MRFTAERTPDGNADEFWALSLAIHAASQLVAIPIDYQSTGTRALAGNTFTSSPAGQRTTRGFGTVRGGNDFGGF